MAKVLRLDPNSTQVRGGGGNERLPHEHHRLPEPRAERGDETLHQVSFFEIGYFLKLHLFFKVTKIKNLKCTREGR